MTEALLSALFLLAALVAGGTIVHGLRGIGGQARAAHAALAGCPQTIPVSYRIIEMQVRRGGAKVIALPVRRAGWRIAQPELRAAA
jgi:hypothetical protein